MSRPSAKARRLLKARWLQQRLAYSGQRSHREAPEPTLSVRMTSHFITFQNDALHRPSVAAMNCTSR
jgi:hypothetical protein